MPAIIDSSPECVTNNEGAKPADDIADFIIQANYQDCAGFMTFGPGSTYGEDGAAATTQYYVLTGVGIAVTLIALLAWMAYENRRLLAFVASNGLGGGSGPPPPQPGTPTLEGNR